MKASRHVNGRHLIGLWLAIVMASGCTGVQPALTQQVEARRLAAELHLQFTKSAEASNRAVMADTDEGAAAAARQARQAADALQRDADAMRPLLQSLGYEEESQHLETFTAALVQYLALDAEILGLAVENSNLKAQRLSFGPARDALTLFRTSLDAAATASKGQCCPDALVASAVIALLDIHAIQARHIAEADDEPMSRMEAEMAAAEATARKALATIRASAPQAARAHLGAAAGALDEFVKVNAELVVLSRRNSDVRSLALSLGRKRLLAAQCDDQLRALQDALARRGFDATR